MVEPIDAKSMVEAMAVRHCPFGGMGAYRYGVKLCTSICAVRNECKELMEELRKRELEYKGEMK